MIFDLISKEYELIEKIGTGATADVFLAMKKEDQTKVAIKVSLTNTEVTDVANKINKEGMELQRINSPFVIGCFDIIKTDSQTALVLEYVDGDTLDNILDKRGVLQEVTSLNLIMDLIKGLNAIHEASGIHRDVKSSNIILGVDGNLKIIDLGIIHKNNDSSLSNDDKLTGTFEYMAPELLEQRRSPSVSTDIFSIGILFYEILIGKRPYQEFFKDMNAYTFINIIDQVKNTNYKRANDINKSIDIRLSKIIDKMIHPDFLERYSSLAEVAQELKRYTNGDIKLTSDEEKELSRNNNIKKGKMIFFTSLGLSFSGLIGVFIWMMV